MSEKIRILQCVTAMDRGGLETVIMNYYRNINHDRFVFDFLTQRKGKFEYSDEIIKMGGKIYSVPAFNPLKIRKYNFEMERFFEEHSTDYDIIHAHNNSFALYVLRAAKKAGYNVRISHSHIADTKFNLVRSFFVRYNKMNLKYFCNVRFACSEKAGRWLFGDEKFTVIKNAIDLDRFAFNEKMREEYRLKYGISSDTILLGHIGRFEEQKNHVFLVKLIKDLKNKGVNAKLMLIGVGALESKIKKIVDNNNLRGDVIFVGSVNNPNDYLNAMDIFVFPSHFEGLGMAVIEAQANGLRCIVAENVVGECEVTPLVKFLPIADNDIDMWSKQIMRDARVPRGCYRGDLVKAGYDIKGAAKRLERIYEELVSVNDLDNWHEEV